MNNIICHQYGIKKAAIFDLDHTLIRPIKNKFSVTDTDWIFCSDNVVSKLKDLYNDNYDIVIVSNQKIIKNKDKIKTEENIKFWKSKINKIGDKLGFPILAFAAIEDDEFRKPRIGFWNRYLTDYNKDSSFYCGDAGGLLKRKINNISYNKDFSNTDLKFALNAGIRFIHRDEFFLNQKQIIGKPSYPIEFNEIKIGNYDDYTIKKKTMIITVGYPGSGKSFYVKNHIKGNYVYISRDLLKSKEKCIKICIDAITNNLSIVIDNTSPSKESRNEFIKLCNGQGYNIICFNFITSKDQSMHNNIYRATINNDRIIVPKIAYNIYKSKYVEPTKNEFDDVIKFDFILNKKYVKDNYFKYMF